MKSQLFQNAWTIYKSNSTFTFSESLKLAWKRYRAVQTLKSNLCIIEFTKTNGEERTCFGTLDQDSITYQYKGSSKRKNPLQVSFWIPAEKIFKSFNLLRLTGLVPAF